MGAPGFCPIYPRIFAWCPSPQAHIVPNTGFKL